MALSLTPTGDFRSAYLPHVHKVFGLWEEAEGTQERTNIATGGEHANSTQRVSKPRIINTQIDAKEKEDEGAKCT